MSFIKIHIEHLVRFELAIAVWKTTLLPLQYRCLVRVVGIEPTTHRLKVYCSIQLSYTRIDAVEKSNGNCNHHNRVRLRIFFMLFISYRRYGTRTHTHKCASDFKSPVSTYSTTGSKLFSLDGWTWTKHSVTNQPLKLAGLPIPPHRDRAPSRARFGSLHHGKVSC